MTLRYIDSELGDKCVCRSELRNCKPRDRELTKAEHPDAELRNADATATELPDGDDATRNDGHLVRAKLERDVQERQAGKRGLRLVFVAPAVPRSFRGIGRS